MTKGMKKLKIVLSVALILIMFPRVIICEEAIDPNTLMRGQYDLPIKISISSPAYKQFAPLSEERTEILNKLLKHLSLSVMLDGHVSETTILVDNEPVYSYIEETEDSIVKTVYSTQPDQLYVHTENESEIDSEFLSFLENHFFRINILLDDLYPMFEKTAEAFKDFGKYSSVSLNFSGYGKGVKRLTIPLPEQYIRDSFPSIIAGLAETEESRNLVQSLIFSGSQKIILLFDQNDTLLRINYDGVIGISDESMRKVSIVWRCVRSDDLKKDNITIKTPAVKGYDKYNITYERTIDCSDPEYHQIKWDMQLDLRDGQNKEKTAFNADLFFKENVFCGKSVFSKKQEGNDTKLTIIPNVKKENGNEYNGTIEITNYSGKIVSSNTEYSVCISPGNKLTDMDYSIALDTDNLYGDISQNEELVREQLADMLVRRMLKLPAEDIMFFSMDIPEDSWQSLVQSLY